MEQATTATFDRRVYTVLRVSAVFFAPRSRHPSTGQETLQRSAFVPATVAARMPLTPRSSGSLSVCLSVCLSCLPVWMSVCLSCLYVLSAGVRACYKWEEKKKEHPRGFAYEAQEQERLRLLL